MKKSFLVFFSILILISFSSGQMVSESSTLTFSMELLPSIAMSLAPLSVNIAIPDPKPADGTWLFSDPFTITTDIYVPPATEMELYASIITPLPSIDSIHLKIIGDPGNPEVAGIDWLLDPNVVMIHTWIGNGDLIADFFIGLEFFSSFPAGQYAGTIDFWLVARNL